MKNYFSVSGYVLVIDEVSIPLRGKGYEKRHIRVRKIEARIASLKVSIPLRGKGYEKPWQDHYQALAHVSIPLRGKGYEKPLRLCWGNISHYKVSIPLRGKGYEKQL